MIAACPMTSDVEEQMVCDKGVPLEWLALQPFELAEHSKACCRTAKAWLRTHDLASRRSETVLAPPNWIRRRWRWGPSEEVVFWCDIVDADIMDCGRLAAVSREILAKRHSRATAAMRASGTHNVRPLSDAALRSIPACIAASQLIDQ